MTHKTAQLGQLVRIARARADLELRQYAAHRAQAEAMRRQVEIVREELAQAITTPAEAMDQWRLTIALVGYRAGQLQRAEDALARMQPSLEAARASAAQAFGRAEAIRQLRQTAMIRQRQDKLRRSG